MISIYMIITALVQMALAKGSMECNLTEPTGTQKCFGALGESLFFHLPTNLKKIILRKNGTYNMLNIANVSVIADEYTSRSTYFHNGTFKLDNARKTDSGDYQLERFGSDGGLLNKTNMHLDIQAPVSKPAVFQMCLTPVQMNISCSSEGDGVKFILSLDGLLLMQTGGHSQYLSSSTVDTLSLAGSTAKQQQKPIFSNVAISLHGQLTGNLMCKVQNNVSTEETVIRLTSCEGSISLFSNVTVAVIASGTTLLLLLALFLGIKHFNKKTRPITVCEDNAEDEIVYSDVTVMKRTITPDSHQNTT